MLRGTWLGMTAALGVGATTLLGAGAAPAQTLNAVMHSDLRILAPIWTTAYIVRNHGYMIYDTLLAVDDKLEVKPQMVKGYTVTPDKLKYTFTLRPGQKFHDGSPVTSKDVVASVKRMLIRETVARGAAPYVASVDGIDDKTFSITLKEPFGFLTLMLPGTSTAYAGIYREKEALTDPNTPITET